MSNIIIRFPFSFVVTYYVCPCTTTGLITGGSLDIDNVLINGTTIGHTDDTDLITLADGVVTVAGEVSMTTLDIGGTNVSSTAAELNY